MSARRPLISGNWKMNNNHFEAIQSVQKLSYLVGKDEVEHVDVSIHPPFTDLRAIQTVIEGDRLPYALGDRNANPNATFTALPDPTEPAAFPASCPAQ